MMDDIQREIDKADELRYVGQEQAAIDRLNALAAKHPDNALVLYELGGAYDYAGFEAQAIPHYRRAIELGLPLEQQARVALQLGSSLRNVGQFEEAVAVLSAAHTRFPEQRALAAFLALALHSAGDSQSAIVMLLDELLRDPAQLDGYERALKHYTDDLR